MRGSVLEPGSAGVVWWLNGLRRNKVWLWFLATCAGECVPAPLVAINVHKNHGRKAPHTKRHITKCDKRMSEHF